MRDKQMREMNRWQRHFSSLSFKMFLFTFLTFMIAAMLAQLVGLALYGNALLREKNLQAHGVSEAMTAGLEQFGCERLLASLNAAPDADPEKLLPHVRRELDGFVQGAPQFDDITMLGLRYRGAEEKH